MAATLLPFAISRPVTFDATSELTEVLSQPDPVRWALQTPLPEWAEESHAYLLHFRVDSDDVEIHALWDALPLELVAEIGQVIALVRTRHPRRPPVIFRRRWLVAAASLRSTEPPAERRYLAACFLGSTVFFVGETDARGAAFLLPRLSPYDVLDRTRWLDPSARATRPAGALKKACSVVPLLRARKSDLRAAPG